MECQGKKLLCRRAAFRVFRIPILELAKGFEPLTL